MSDRDACALRERLRRAGVFTISLAASPGAGRTTFLETILSLLQLRFRVGVLVVAPITESEKLRIERGGALVKKVRASAEGRLDAGTVHSALNGWRLDDLDFLFIEDIGGLASHGCSDLGEDLRVVLLSATQGDDKPLKYPAFFESADVAVITMIDLAAAVRFDCAAAERNMQAARRGMEVVRFSARSGEGVRHCLSTLVSRRQEAGAEIMGIRGMAAIQPAESDRPTLL